jgi:glycosyltransferase involved in cell wall biosynthesis
MTMSSDNRVLRILNLIETTGPGGAETVLLNIVRRLDRSRFEPTVVVTGTGWLHEQLIAAGIDTRIEASTKANDWDFLSRIVALIRAKQVDIVHSHLDGMNFYAALAGLRSRRPVIATYHGAIGDWNRRNWKNRLKYGVIRRTASRIVTVSDYLRANLTTVWGFPQAKMERIYNGVDFAAFENAAVKQPLRQELNLPDDALLVGMIGNIRQSKGYPYLVEAARSIVRRFQNAYFIIVGHGKGSLLEDLEKQIGDAGLNHRVILTGFRDDVPQIVKQLDLFVLSSTTEGLSIATIEAMGAGKPVVVTASGGPEEIVIDGATGYIVPPADAGALARRVGDLLASPEERARLGAAAAEAVRSRFSIEENVTAYQRLYQEIAR